MLDSKYLRDSLESNGIFCKFYKFSEETITSVQAAKLLNVPLSSIAKSVLLVDEHDKPVLVVLPGYKRIPQKKLARRLGKKKLRLATRDEVLNFTGYQPGGIPPVFHRNKIDTVIDEELLDKEYVIVGGGDTMTLLKIKVSDIIRLQNAKIVEI